MSKESDDAEDKNTPFDDVTHWAGKLSSKSNDSDELYNYLEYYLDSNHIKNVWASGKQLLKNKKLLTMDEDMLYDKLKEI